MKLSYPQAAESARKIFRDLVDWERVFKVHYETAISGDEDARRDGLTDVVVVLLSDLLDLKPVDPRVTIGDYRLHFVNRNTRAVGEGGLDSRTNTLFAWNYISPWTLNKEYPLGDPLARCIAKFKSLTERAWAEAHVYHELIHVVQAASTDQFQRGIFKDYGDTGWWTSPQELEVRMEEARYLVDRLGLRRAYTAANDDYWRCKDSLRYFDAFFTDEFGYTETNWLTDVVDDMVERSFSELKGVPLCVQFTDEEMNKPVTYRRDGRLYTIELDRKLQSVYDTPYSENALLIIEGAIASALGDVIAEEKFARDSRFSWLPWTSSHRESQCWVDAKLASRGYGDRILAFRGASEERLGYERTMGLSAFEMDAFRRHAISPSVFPLPVGVRV